MARFPMLVLCPFVALVLPLSSVRAQNAISLKYGTPAKDGLRYRILTEEKISQLGHDGKVKRLKTRNDKVVAQKLRRHGDGHVVSMKVLASELLVNGTPIATKLDGGRFEAVRSLRGRYGDATGRDVPAWNRLGLIFPRRPLRIGETWTITDAPTKGFPVPVTTEYRLEGIRVVKGRTCAVITGSTKVNETLPRRGVTIRIVTKAKIFFDVADGVLLRSKSRTRYNLLSPEDNAMGLKRMVKDVQVVCELL